MSQSRVSQVQQFAYYLSSSSSRVCVGCRYHWASEEDGATAIPADSACLRGRPVLTGVLSADGAVLVGASQQPTGLPVYLTNAPNIQRAQVCRSASDHLSK